MTVKVQLKYMDKHIFTMMVRPHKGDLVSLIGTNWKVDTVILTPNNTVIDVRVSPMDEIPYVDLPDYGWK